MHGIEQLQNGEYSFWFDGEPAWHKIPNNVQIDNMNDLDGIMAACHADFEVIKAPNAIEWPVGSGKFILPKNKQEQTFALVRDRDGRILDPSVGPNWTPVQNREAFEFIKEFVEAGDMKPETAGVLRDGRMVWVLAKLNESFSTADGDKVEGYLLFTTYHQFGWATDVRFIATRVVCQNTHAIALNEYSKYRVSVNHSQKFNAAEVKNTLGISHDVMQKYQAAMETLMTAKYTESSLAEYADKVYPITGENKREKERSRNAEKLIAVVNEQPGAEYAPNSFFNAYNAVTFLTDNILGRNADSRLASAWYGTGMRTKAKALKIALQMAA